MSSNWKDIIATIAPTLASALGGPLAGLAVGTIGAALGLDASTEERVSAAIAGANASDLQKIKDAELTFRVQMKQLDVDVIRIASDDRNSARQREAVVKDHTPQILATCIVGGYMFVQGFLLIHVVPTEMRDIIMRMLGLLDGSLMMVLSYYFGSSSTSHAKDDTINKLSA